MSPSLLAWRAVPLPLRRAVPLALLLSLSCAPRTARAAPPGAELMARLMVHAARFEAMRTHASYALVGKMERLDGDGQPSGVKEMTARVEADGTRARLDVVRYTEDGEDKTVDARDKAREADAEPAAEKEKNVIRMPFLAAEQGRYVFDQVAVDGADPARIRIAFVPRVAAENAIEGSAWIDTRTATVLSAGFKISKPGTFVDYVHVTVEFGAPTALGPAVSRVTVEGKGGILFLRKRFRGAATLSDYRISPAP